MFPMNCSKAKSREARPFAHATATLPPPTQDRFLPLRQRPPRARGVLTALIGTVSSVGTLGLVRFT